MSLQLAPDIASKIQEKVESGSYPDADTVIRDAMALLDERDRQHAWLLAALEEGERGSRRPFTPEVAEEIFQNARRRAQAGERPHPDVCP